MTNFMKYFFFYFYTEQISLNKAATAASHGTPCPNAHVTEE
jgi:hypothetical protein